jgi:hypothetical protein
MTLIAIFAVGVIVGVAAASAAYYRKDAKREHENSRQMYDLANCVVEAMNRNTEAVYQLRAAFSGEIPPAIEVIRQFNTAMPPWLRRLEHLEKKMREYNNASRGE